MSDSPPDNTWPEETGLEPPKTLLTDPNVPKGLHAVIGYCSGQSVGEIPSGLVAPSDILKAVSDVKQYLFGSELQNLMKKSLSEFTTVCVCHIFKVWIYLSFYLRISRLIWRSSLKQ